ncbi:MAG: helix-hairpin-helix domain-containing protein [Candidatus Poribacteria bacterium]|nr:helix-hairpin-helix domain-containing protein [Candidatus Poribacteria bacterium]
MKWFGEMTSGEKRVLGVLVVATLLGSGVAVVRKAYPEWFFGTPSYFARGNVALPAAEATIALPPSTDDAEPPPADDATTPQSPSGALINLNTADATALESLPGIGAVLAERIILYRAERGGFKRVDELNDVSGIGEKKLAAIRALVTVDDTTPSPKTGEREERPTSR